MCPRVWACRSRTPSRRSTPSGPSLGAERPQERALPGDCDGLDQEPAFRWRTSRRTAAPPAPARPLDQQHDGCGRCRLHITHAHLADAGGPVWVRTGATELGWDGNGPYRRHPRRSRIQRRRRRNTTRLRDARRHGVGATLVHISLPGGEWPWDCCRTFGRPCSRGVTRLRRAATSIRSVTSRRRSRGPTRHRHGVRAPVGARPRM